MSTTSCSEHSNQSSILTEKLAYWFFRLNGCLLLENFIVHPPNKGSQLTDIDILGVRFPFRKEISGGNKEPMQDFGLFAEPTQKPLIVIAEVKLNEASLNEPAKRKAVLMAEMKAIGVIPDDEVEAAADDLCEKNRYEHSCCSIRMFIMCDKYNDKYLKN